MPSPTVDLASASAGFTQYVLDPSQSAADPQGASVQVFGGSSKIVAVPRGREWSLGLGPAPAAQSESAEERPATFSEFILEAANSPLGYGCRPDANDHSQATIHTTPSDRVTDRAKDPWDAFLMDIAVSEGERSPARSEELKRSAFDRGKGAAPSLGHKSFFREETMGWRSFCTAIVRPADFASLLYPFTIAHFHVSLCTTPQS